MSDAHGCTLDTDDGVGGTVSVVTGAQKVGSTPADVQLDVVVGADVCRQTFTRDKAHNRCATRSVGGTLTQKKYGVTPTHTFFVPDNVTSVWFRVTGGGAAGNCVDPKLKKGGAGGAAGIVKMCLLDVVPGQKFEIVVGRGGQFTSNFLQQNTSLSTQQLLQGAYSIRSAEASMVVDCNTETIVAMAEGGAGFCGGESLARESKSQSGIAALHNGGMGFCNADNEWVGYGGGGGGGAGGGRGGCVQSNCRATSAGAGVKNSGGGGGGSAFLVDSPCARHIVPGAGADGHVQVEYCVETRRIP